MTGPSSLEAGSGHVTRTGAREVFGILAVVVVLSGCARFETSGDGFTRRASEAHHQIILHNASSRTLSPVLDGDPQGCFHCGTVPQEEILRPVPVAATGDGFHATPQNLGAEMVSPPGPGAVTARRPAETPISFPLYFALDSDKLTAAGQTAIDAAVTVARKIGATDFAVTGHAGLVGPGTHNIEPSLRRAKVVSEALVARGIDPTRINIANQVEVESSVATAGDLGDLAGRRVDIILLKQD
jgi:outer membrane protein OmpA-like peptidoglycan-associated protein